MSVQQEPFASRRTRDPVERLTAERMMQSHLGTARVTILGEADATALVELRRRVRDRCQSQGVKVTYTHLFVKIAALALKRHREVNARLEGEELLYLEEVNVGVAFADSDGRLVVPVIRDADALSVAEIAQCSAVLEERFQKKALSPNDMRGGTFTLTNLGMFPAVSWMTPLINPPQCAILGTGHIRQDSTMRWSVGLSLTHDHRILNGVPAGAFFQTVADLIADPEAAGVGE